ncbi:MAG: nitroreductase family protein [Actinobacteria bacterium]|nr:nitroreductase family protein [Actinomycetota bacterium]
MEAFGQRKSSRKFSTRSLELQDLADIFWAGFGLSRPHLGTGINSPGSHTAPTAHNWQEIDIFAAMAGGLYLYDPADNELRGLLQEGIRRFPGNPMQPFVLDAPVILIYVADLERMDDAGDWDKSVFPWADTAVIAENVYLACASLGLATVVRALFDRPALSMAMQLRDTQLVTFSQPLGYPG